MILSNILELEEYFCSTVHCLLLSVRNSRYFTPIHDMLKLSILLWRVNLKNTKSTPYVFFWPTPTIANKFTAYYFITQVDQTWAMHCQNPKLFVYSMWFNIQKRKWCNESSTKKSVKNIFELNLLSVGNMKSQNRRCYITLG